MDITNTLIRQKKQSGNKFIDITERVNCLEKENKYYYITFNQNNPNNSSYKSTKK